MKDFNFKSYKFGSGNKTILILPGWGDTRNTFNYLINNLKDKYTIYIFDYPGFGSSIFPNYDLDIFDYSDYLYKFIKEKKIHNPYIISHSFGCRISIILIGKYRILIDKLIIIGGAGIRRKSIKRFFKVKKYKFLKKIIFAIPNHYRNNYLNHLSKKYGSIDYQSLSYNMKKTFSNIVNCDLRKYIKYIYCPTLLIWGENDSSTPLIDGIYMNKHISDSGLITIKKGSHFVYLEYPLYILNIILNFFE